MDISIEDLSVGIINSRKLEIRAVVNVMARNLEEKDDDIACAILEMGYEQKTEELNMLCLVENKKEMIQMQKDKLLLLQMQRRV